MEITKIEVDQITGQRIPIFLGRDLPYFIAALIDADLYKKFIKHIKGNIPLTFLDGYDQFAVTPG